MEEKSLSFESFEQMWVNFNFIVHLLPTKIKIEELYQTSNNEDAPKMKMSVM